MSVTIVDADVAELERRLIQNEVDVKALAESVEKMIGVVKQLQAVQDETLAVMRQLLSARKTG